MDAEKADGRRPMTKHSKCPAFTLIELVIGVAIIAIPALIAVPNLLEAQTRQSCPREGRSADHRHSD